MKKTKRIFAVLLAALLLASAAPLTALAVQMYAVNVYTEWMSGNFSPFFSERSADRDVCALTQIDLLTTDRSGMVVPSAVKGTVRRYTEYQKFTFYGPADLTVTQTGDRATFDFQLRRDIRFSDGQALTADDVIFSMYVLADPTYDGPCAFGSLPVEGLDAYRAGMQSLQSLILADGEGGYKNTTYYTKAQYDAYWAAFNKAGLQLVDGICAYLTGAGIAAENASVAEMAAMWGYDLPGNGTKNDFWNAVKQAYRGAAPADINTETGASDLFTALLDECLGRDADTYHNGVKTGASAAAISGIKKIDDYRVQVTLTGATAADVYGFSLYIAPMHYYGSRAKYDYGKNKFGFEKGDLSSVRAKNGAPMGAGPYRLESFGNGMALLSAYNGYYLGAPRSGYICLIPNDASNVAYDVQTGLVDLVSPAFSQAVLPQFIENNRLKSVGSVSLSALESSGYGYIGISADAVKVGDDPGSAASKNLRKAFATMFACLRETAVSKYFGVTADVIEYPVAGTSWAAPQKWDAGYRAAFSLDVNGENIYPSYASAGTKYTYARDAALGFLEAAGYTVEDYWVYAAPEGAKTEFEIWIPGGTQDHPAFQLAKDAAAKFRNMGITLTVRDVADPAEFWAGVADGRADMWSAAWGENVDPDMYQLYFSGSGELPAGSSNNMYDISDETLNALILQARNTMDQTVRKQLYRQCLDIIADWAVEVPFYQSKTYVPHYSWLYGLEGVTPYYGWTRLAEKLEIGSATGNASEAVIWQNILFAAPDLTVAKLQASENGKSILVYYGDLMFTGNDPIVTGMSFTGKNTRSSQTVVVKGDNDSDGRVTTNDARNALRMAIGLDDPGLLQIVASKVTGGPVITNPSLKVTTEDARAILRAAIGLETLALV